MVEKDQDVVTPAYQPRDPSGTVLYQVIAAHLETFLGSLGFPVANKLLKKDKKFVFTFLRMLQILES